MEEGRVWKVSAIGTLVYEVSNGKSVPYSEASLRRKISEGGGDRGWYKEGLSILKSVQLAVDEVLDRMVK
jgi:hypothetical protein